MTHDDITKGLILTSRCSSIGLICFCIVGIVATELTLIPEIARLLFVLVGAAFIAVGAEGGSLFSIVAAFERDGTLRGWDIVGAIFSQLATLSAVIMAFATLTGASSDWAAFVSVYGYITTTGFISVDATFNYVALGLHLRNSKKLRLAEVQDNLDYQRDWIVIQRELVQIEREKFALETQRQLYNSDEKETGPMQPVVQQETEKQLKDLAVVPSDTTQQPEVLAVVPSDTTVVQLSSEQSATATTKRDRGVQLLRNNGHSPQQIADLVGCSYEYVRKIKKEI